MSKTQSALQTFFHDTATINGLPSSSSWWSSASPVLSIKSHKSHSSSRFIHISIVSLKKFLKKVLSRFDRPYYANTFYALTMVSHFCRVCWMKALCKPSDTNSPAKFNSLKKRSLWQTRSHRSYFFPIGGRRGCSNTNEDQFPVTRPSTVWQEPRPLLFALWQYFIKLSAEVCTACTQAVVGRKGGWGRGKCSGRKFTSEQDSVCNYFLGVWGAVSSLGVKSPALSSCSQRRKEGREDHYHIRADPVGGVCDRGIYMCWTVGCIKLCYVHV